MIPDTEDENTVITIKIKPAAGVSELTVAQVDSIRHVLLKWPPSDLKRTSSAAPSARQHHGVRGSDDQFDVRFLSTGTAPAAVTPEPPATLPPAATGLPARASTARTRAGLSSPKGLPRVAPGQALPGFAMAIILVVVMILMIIVYVASTICGALCCKCCNGAYKPRKFTKRDLVINKVVILVFVALTAAGCFIIFAEGPRCWKACPT